MHFVVICLGARFQIFNIVNFNANIISLYICTLLAT